jgi:hypothetical protein
MATPDTDAAAELVALHLYRVRRQQGQALSPDLVHDVFAELATHPGDCGCGVCEAARHTTPQRALATALHWPRDLRRRT